MRMTGRKILVADDEATVRSYIATILRKEGYDPLEAVDGLDALEQVEQLSAPVSLLVTDIRMPRLDGIALARGVTAISPGIPVIYISGYPFDFDRERTGDPHRPCAFLSKPFTRKALLDAVQRCLPPPDKVAGGG